MCENKVEQIIPTRYSAKVLQMRCGSTSIYGEPLYCEACQKRGMRARPVTEYEYAAKRAREDRERAERAAKQELNSIRSK